jgi:hypothetical protein
MYEADESLCVEESVPLLACEIPEGATAGSTFHVISPANKYYEVVVPENAAQGDTINILLEHNEFETATQSAEDKSIGATLLRNLVKVGNLLRSTAVKIDSDYKITEKVKSIDEKYEISSRTKTFLVPYVERAKDLNGEYKITEKLIAAGTTAIVFAREIDEKYAISASVGRFVQVSRNSIRKAIDKASELQSKLKDAQNSIPEVVASSKEAASETINKVHESTKEVVASTIAKVFKPKKIAIYY